MLDLGIYQTNISSFLFLTCVFYIMHILKVTSCAMYSLQAEAMVAEWKEYLWDVPEERAALWGHCQTLFLRYSFPPLQVILLKISYFQL